MAGQSIDPGLVAFPVQKTAAFGHCGHGLGGFEAGLLEKQDAESLIHGWRTVSRVRNAVTLVRGKPGDHLPRDTREKAAVASVMGYPPGASDQLVNDFLRHTRRTRAVVDRVFWA